MKHEQDITEIKTELSKVHENVETHHVRFDRLETKLGDHDARFARLETKIDLLSKAMIKGFKSMEAQIITISNRMARWEERHEDAYERIVTLEAAFDKDSEKLVNHERRIRKLEKRPT